MRPRPAVLIVVLLALALLGCEGDTGETANGTRTDVIDLAASFREQTAAVVAQQEADGVAPTPLGRLLEDCLAVDDAALEALAAALGVGEESAEVLNTTLQQPDGPDATLSCAVRFGEASAGAVVLSVGPTGAGIEELTATLIAADYVEVPDASAQGLADDEVLLFDATGFAASRAVWAPEGFQIGLTANTDLADSGALLDALPVAVEEIRRVLN